MSEVDTKPKLVNHHALSADLTRFIPFESSLLYVCGNSILKVDEKFTTQEFFKCNGKSIHDINLNHHKKIFGVLEIGEVEDNCISIFDGSSKISTLKLPYSDPISFSFSPSGEFIAVLFGIGTKKLIVFNWMLEVECCSISVDWMKSQEKTVDIHTPLSKIEWGPILEEDLICVLEKDGDGVQLFRFNSTGSIEDYHLNEVWFFNEEPVYDICFSPHGILLTVDYAVLTMPFGLKAGEDVVTPSLLLEVDLSFCLWVKDKLIVIIRSGGIQIYNTLEQPYVLAEEYDWPFEESLINLKPHPHWVFGYGHTFSGKLVRMNFFSGQLDLLYHFPVVYGFNTVALFGRNDMLYVVSESGRMFKYSLRTLQFQQETCVLSLANLENEIKITSASKLFNGTFVIATSKGHLIIYDNNDNCIFCDKLSQTGLRIIGQLSKSTTRSLNGMDLFAAADDNGAFWVIDQKGNLILNEKLDAKITDSFIHEETRFWFSLIDGDIVYVSLVDGEAVHTVYHTSYPIHSLDCISTEQHIASTGALLLIAASASKQVQIFKVFVEPHTRSFGDSLYVPVSFVKVPGVPICVRTLGPDNSLSSVITNDGSVMVLESQNAPVHLDTRLFDCCLWKDSVHSPKITALPHISSFAVVCPSGAITFIGTHIPGRQISHKLNILRDFITVKEGLQENLLPVISESILPSELILQDKTVEERENIALDEERELERKQIKQHKQQQIEQLYTELKDVFEENNACEDIDMLDEEAFVIDKQYINNMLRKNKRYLDNYKRELQSNIQKLQVEREELKAVKYDSQSVHSEAVSSIDVNSRVNNIPIPVWSKKEQNRFKFCRNLKMVMNDEPYEEDFKEEEVYKDGELRGYFNKLIQINLLKKCCIKSSENFNNIFNRLKSQKGLLEDEGKMWNKRIFEIFEDLGLDKSEAELFELEDVREDRPDFIITVYPDEVDAEKPPEVEQDEGAAKTEEQIRQERAKLHMMGGKLDLTDDSSSILKKPSFYDLPKNQLTRDQREKIREYDEEVERIKEEREKKKKALETELRNIYNSIKVRTKEFDVLVDLAFKLRVKTVEEIFWQETRVLAIMNGLIEIVQIEEALKQLVTIQKRTMSSQPTLEEKIEHVDAMIEEIRVGHQRLQEEDSHIMQQARKEVLEFNDMLIKHWRLCGKKFRDSGALSTPRINKNSKNLRMSAIWRDATAETFNQTPFGVFRETDVLKDKDLEERIISLDIDEADCPEEVEPELWSRFLEFRRLKNQSEMFVFLHDQRLLNLTKFHASLKESLDALKREIEGINVKIYDLNQVLQYKKLDCVVAIRLRNSSFETERSNVFSEFFEHPEAAIKLIETEYADVSEPVEEIDDEDKKALMEQRKQEFDQLIADVPLRTFKELSIPELLIVGRGHVQKLNNRAFDSAVSLLKTLRKVKKLRFQNSLTEWELKKTDMEIEDIVQMTKDFQLLRVTRHMQSLVQHSNIEDQHKKTIEGVKRRVDTSKKRWLKKKKDMEKMISKLHKKAVKLESDNEGLKDQIEDLQDVVANRMVLCRFEKAEDTRAQEAAGELRLKNLYKRQLEEIEFLQAELARLRRKTFPSITMAK
ncbi:hypothetical protein PCE1_000650 [Barthelona sp. PCE]